MANTRKTYTAEFKLQAVRMVTDQHLAVAEMARRLGITEGRLHDWLKAFRAQGADAFPGHGRLAPHDEELHRLRAEAHRLKAEREILKKAAADFAGGVLSPLHGGETDPFADGPHVIGELGSHGRGS